MLVETCTRLFIKETKHKYEARGVARLAETGAVTKRLNMRAEVHISSEPHCGT